MKGRDEEMKLWNTNPLHGIRLTGGRGSTVFDDRGRSYTDMWSGTWCNVLGYGHPRLARALRDQAGGLLQTGAPFGTPEVDDALKSLADILPPELDRAVFLNSGSEAVELALKMAMAATGRQKIVAAEKGYYGGTVFALSISEPGRTSTFLPKYAQVLRLPAPHCVRCPSSSDCGGGNFPCLAALGETPPEEGAAAVIWEPVLGGGILVPPPGYGARLRELAAARGALFISEEITTGMGRTGRWFGFSHENLVPDILVIGKALGGGLPVSAVVTTKEVEERAVSVLGRHVQSHQNTPLSGRIAAEVIGTLRDQGLVERSEEMGAMLLSGLREIQARFPCIREVRGRGLMVGAELTPEAAGRGPDMSKRLLGKGYIQDFHQLTSTFRLFPPFVITRDEIRGFLAAFGDVLAEQK